MSHEKETKQTPAAETKAPETEAKAPEQETPKAEKPEEKHEGKHHHETAALQAKLDEAEKKNEELKNQLLRTAAEYDNYRKRSQREADQKFNDGVSHAVTQILGILDTLDMAANAACADQQTVILAVKPEFQHIRCERRDPRARILDALMQRIGHISVHCRIAGPHKDRRLILQRDRLEDQPLRFNSPVFHEKSLPPASYAPACASISPGSFPGSTLPLRRPAPARGARHRWSRRSPYPAT